MRQVGDGVEHLAQYGVALLCLLLQAVDLLAHGFGLPDQLGGVLFVLFAARDLLGDLVALSFQRFRLGDRLPPRGIDLAEILEHHGGIHAPLAQFLFDQVQMFTYKCQIKHKKGSVNLSPGSHHGSGAEPLRIRSEGAPHLPAFGRCGSKLPHEENGEGSARTSGFRPRFDLSSASCTLAG